MKAFLLLMTLIFNFSQAHAAEICKSRQYEPSKEYCFVFVEKTTGEVDRKEIRFELQNTGSRFENTVVVDDEVEAVFKATQQKYSIALFKRVDLKHERPLSHGFYNRTGKLLDFNTSGFGVSTDKARYTLTCVTEDYL